jgi:hypothetical protein
MVKDGLERRVAPHKRVPSNNIRPEVDNHKLNHKLVEVLVKELELLLLNNTADPKQETEEPLQTQDTQLGTTYLEVELLLNKNKHKSKILLL